MEDAVFEHEFEQLVTEENGTKLIMEFPKGTSNNNSISQDIQHILESILMEYLKQSFMK